MYRALQCSEFRLRIKRVNIFQFVVCLQIHPLAGDVMNSRLFLMHSASFDIVYFKFVIHYIASAWLRICKQTTHVQ